MAYSFEDLIKVLISEIIILAICGIVFLLIKIIRKIYYFCKNFNENLEKIIMYKNKGMYVITVGFIVLFTIMMCIDFLDDIFTTFMELIFDFYKSDYTDIVTAFMKDNFKYVFWIYIILSFINFITNFLYNRKQNQKQEMDLLELDEDIENNTLYKNLYDYFQNKDNKNPIIVKGEWGAGKTYSIDEFFENYYKFKKQKVYRISCFGITTREQLIDLVMDICEKEDKSLYKEIINIIGKIPIIGEFLKNILGPKYDLNSLKENSIFIFDNFERIEPYIKKERNEDQSNKLDVIPKYNIVTGFIDNLIEIYNMKVVILVNDNELVEEYFYKNFIEKLSSKIYTINSKTVSVEEIWNDAMSSMLMSNEIKQKLNEIFEQVKIGAEMIWQESNCENIRILKRTIYNYIEFIKYLILSEYNFDKQNNEEIGLFYSYFIKRISKGIYSGISNTFSSIKKGENISAYIEKYKFKDVQKDDEIINFFSEIDTIWYYDYNLSKLWENLENNHYALQKELEEINVETKKKVCLNKFNYTDTKVNEIEYVYWDDVLCLLKMEKDNVIPKIIELMDNEKINFKFRTTYVGNDDFGYNYKNDLNYAFNAIQQYKVEEIFKERIDLTKSLFKCLEKKIPQINNPEKVPFDIDAYEIYERLHAII